MTRNYFKYCPRCAGRLKTTDTRVDPAYLQCASCGYSIFDNPVGATEAVIVRKDKALMMRRAKAPRRGFWDIPGGFLDGFETPEHGIIREVREETGLAFKPITLIGVYVNTQYQWDGRRVPIIVASFLGTASGHLVPSDEASSYAWRELRRIRQTAFNYQKQVFRDIGRVR